MENVCSELNHLMYRNVIVRDFFFIIRFYFFFQLSIYVSFIFVEIYLDVDHILICVYLLLRCFFRSSLRYDHQMNARTPYFHICSEQTKYFCFAFSFEWTLCRIVYHSMIIIDSLFRWIWIRWHLRYSQMRVFWNNEGNNFTFSKIYLGYTFFDKMFLFFDSSGGGGQKDLWDPSTRIYDDIAYSHCVTVWSSSKNFNS